MNSSLSNKDTAFMNRIALKERKIEENEIVGAERLYKIKTFFKNIKNKVNKRIETRKVEQHFTKAVYYLTKSLDTMRPVIVNDGWEHTVSDIITLHDYEEVGDTLYKRYTEYKDQILTTEVYHSGKSALANGYEYKGQPIIISEYGGIAFNNDDSGWGYGNKVNTKEDFIKRFDDITTAVKKIPYCCGFCYTQVSDVQQEINGLMDMERNFKVEPEIIKEINERKVGYWRTFM